MCICCRIVCSQGCTCTARRCTTPSPSGSQPLKHTAQQSTHAKRYHTLLYIGGGQGQSGDGPVGTGTVCWRTRFELGGFTPPETEGNRGDKCVKQIGWDGDEQGAIGVHSQGNLSTWAPSHLNKASRNPNRTLCRTSTISQRKGRAVCSIT